MQANWRLHFTPFCAACLLLLCVQRAYCRGWRLHFLTGTCERASEGNPNPDGTTEGALTLMVLQAGGSLVCTSYESAQTLHSVYPNFGETMNELSSKLKATVTAPHSTTHTAPHSTTHTARLTQHYSHSTTLTAPLTQHHSHSTTLRVSWCMG